MCEYSPVAVLVCDCSEVSVWHWKCAGYFGMGVACAIQYDLTASVVVVCSLLKAYLIWISIFRSALADLRFHVSNQEIFGGGGSGVHAPPINIHKLSSFRFVISRDLQHVEYLGNRIWHDSGTSTSLVRLCLSSSPVHDIQSRMHHQC